MLLNIPVSTYYYTVRTDWL